MTVSERGRIPREVTEAYPAPTDSARAPTPACSGVAGRVAKHTNASPGGHLPSGLEIKDGWTPASNDGGFRSLSVVDVATLLEFSAQFKDLNDELEITPVVELNEGVNIAMKAYAWVDSIS